MSANGWHEEAGAAGRVPAAVARQAVDWYVRLREAGESRQLCRDLQHWRDQNALHDRAWRQIEQVNQALPQIDAMVAMAALSPVKGRRRTLRLLTIGATVGMTALLARQWHPWDVWQADFRTTKGEWRTVTLPDGSQLTLNTDTAVRLAYTAAQRQVRLLAGEILIRTVADPMGRPFSVQSAQGDVLALGTVFSVRQLDVATRVAVYAHAVRMTPAAHESVRLEAGWQADFTRDRVEGPTPAQERQAAWADGVLDVLDMPLETFLAQLSRYRAGYLGCDPDIAGLRLSGVFPLADTDAVLQSVQQALPVRVVSRTRYWTRVMSAQVQSSGGLRR